MFMSRQFRAGACMGHGATYQADRVSHCDGANRLRGWLTRDMQNLSCLGRGQAAPNRRVSMDQITILLPKVYPLGTKSNLNWLQR